MRLETAIRKQFFERLLETPAGRAHVLNLMVAGEEGDEAGVFDRLALLADDEAGRKAVIHHKSDEERHAALYRACLVRTGVEPRPVPDRLMLIRWIVRRANQDFARGIDQGSAARIESRTDVMNTYALLLVIEERGVQQFPILGAMFRAAGDAETADVFDRVTEDERRHVMYCRAMGRRYAPDLARWDAAVAYYRRIEEQAFREIGFATIADALAHDLLRFGGLGRVLGRMLCWLDDRIRAGVKSLNSNALAEPA